MGLTNGPLVARHNGTTNPFGRTEREKNGQHHIIRKGKGNAPFRLIHRDNARYKPDAQSTNQEKNPSGATQISRVEENKVGQKKKRGLLKSFVLLTQ